MRRAALAAGKEGPWGLLVRPPIVRVPGKWAPTPCPALASKAVNFKLPQDSVILLEALSWVLNHSLIFKKISP